MSHDNECRSSLIVLALGFSFLKNNMLLFKGGMVETGRISVLKLWEKDIDLGLKRQVLSFQRNQS